MEIAAQRLIGGQYGRVQEIGLGTSSSDTSPVVSTVVAELSGEPVRENSVDM
jgi:hypothetical protein